MDCIYCDSVLILQKTRLVFSDAEDTLWTARKGSGRREGQLYAYCSPSWSRQTREALYPIRSYSVKAEPKDNDLCSHLKVQSGLWDVCFLLLKLELWPMHWMLTFSCQDVPQTLKGKSADFLLSYFAPKTLQILFSETSTVILYPGPL